MNRADGRVLDWVFTLAGMLFATLVGLAFLWLENPSARFTASLWALACVVAGGFLGFLFGIPRVLQHDPIAPPRPGPAGPSGPAAGGYDDAEGGYRMQVDTNLEQISDWLTKIIVGVGLIELRELPGVLDRAAGFIAVGLGASPAAKVQALALILYFGVLGFLGTYIQTRLYLQGAFRRADLTMLSVGGSLLTLKEALEQQAELLTSLSQKVAGLAKAAPSAATTTGTPTPAVPPSKPRRSILWVDDHPRNNSYLIQSLTDMGIEVVTSLSTQDAESKLKARDFDIIISDMGRREGLRENPTAGLDLVRLVRGMGPSTPIIIYASQGAIAAHGSEAQQSQPVEVTSSPAELLSKVQTLL